MAYLTKEQIDVVSSMIKDYFDSTIKSYVEKEVKAKVNNLPDTAVKDIVGSKYFDDALRDGVKKLMSDKFK